MFPIWLSVTTFIGMALTFGPRLGPSPMITSWVIAGVVLVLAFTQPFFGQLSDTYGRDRLMMFGMLSLIGLFVTVIAMFRWHFEIIYLIPFLCYFRHWEFSLRTCSSCFTRRLCSRTWSRNYYGCLQHCHKFRNNNWTTTRRISPGQIWVVELVLCRSRYPHRGSGSGYSYRWTRIFAT